MDVVGVDLLRRAGAAHQVDVVSPDIHQRHPDDEPEAEAEDEAASTAPVRTTDAETAAIAALGPVTTCPDTESPR
jgi:hypothetical protein